MRIRIRGRRPAADSARRGSGVGSNTGRSNRRTIRAVFWKVRLECYLGGNMTGWSRGTLTITAKFYVNGAYRTEHSHTCYNETACSVPNTTTQFDAPKSWEVVATGCGPGCVTHSKSA
jgi:hypothetical protein